MAFSKSQQEELKAKGFRIRDNITGATLGYCTGKARVEAAQWIAQGYDAVVEDGLREGPPHLVRIWIREVPK